jgi:hypothetical protein
MNLQIKIPPLLREQCVNLFGLCEQFRSPNALRSFVDSVQGGEYVLKCIDNKDALVLDDLISKLLRNGRSLLEPALFDLLDLLAERYAGDETPIRPALTGSLFRPTPSGMSRGPPRARGAGSRRRATTSTNSRCA